MKAEPKSDATPSQSSPFTQTASGVVSSHASRWASGMYSAPTGSGTQSFFCTALRSTSARPRLLSTRAPSSRAFESVLTAHVRTLGSIDPLAMAFATSSREERTPASPKGCSRWTIVGRQGEGTAQSTPAQPPTANLESVQAPQWASRVAVRALLVAQATRATWLRAAA